MEELEFLNELVESIRMRLEELSSILSKVDEPTTNAALSNNHKKGMEELAMINERIRELKKNK